MSHRAAAAFLLLLAAQEDAPLKTPWGRIEWKADAVHLVIDAWPSDGKVALPRLNNPIGTVYLLNDPAKTPLGFQPNLSDWTVSKPKTPTEPAVVVVEVKGKPRVAGETPLLVAAADGSFTLPAHEASAHGKLLRYEPQPHKNTIGYWADAADWCEWKFKAEKGGSFKILLLQGCGKGQGGSEVKITVAGQTLDYTVEDTGGFQAFVEKPAGTFTIEKPGEYGLEIRVARKAKAAVMDVRQIRLVPAE